MRLQLVAFIGCVDEGQMFRLGPSCLPVNPERSSLIECSAASGGHCRGHCSWSGQIDLYRQGSMTVHPPSCGPGGAPRALKMRRL